MDEWRSTTIGALRDAGIADLQTGPFGSQLHARDYVEEGVPVVPTEAIRNRRIDHSVLPKIPEQKAEELSRHLLRLGDILFARRGVQAAGHVAYVKPEEDGFICGTGAIRLRVKDPSRVDAEFLSHILSDPRSIGWFKFHAVGATMPNLNEGIIRTFPLQLPPLQEQHAIARILTALDERVQVNHDISTTLEAMARALFKSWFVDFEPVHCKAQGWDTDLPETVDVLFPDRLVDSPFGHIPDGWSVHPLSDVADQLRDSKKPFDVPDVVFSHYSIPAYDAGQSPSAELGQSIKSQKSRVPAGTVLLSKLNPDIQRVWLVDVQPHEHAVCSTEFLVLRPRRQYGRSLLYCHALSASFREQMQSLTTGTSKSHQRAPAREIMALPVVLPPGALADAFESIAGPLLERVLSTRSESHTLVSLRDTLLPKLVSGELRVNEAERLVAPVV